jgi:hypothetical protein
MVGVSNPIMRRDHREGWRFIAGFGAGLAVATAVLTGPLLLLSAAAHLAPQPVRAGMLVVLVLMLGVADLLNRTPHVWRQVPQRFARELNDYSVSQGASILTQVLSMGQGSCEKTPSSLLSGEWIVGNL